MPKLKCKCGKPAARHRQICNTCMSRDWIKKNPVRKLYNNLKSSAVRRGKEFNLTFDIFKQKLIDSGYLSAPKKTMSVDRVNNSEGYTDNNIRFISVVENSRKYMTEDKIPF